MHWLGCRMQDAGCRMLTCKPFTNIYPQLERGLALNLHLNITAIPTKHLNLFSKRATSLTHHQTASYLHFYLHQIFLNYHTITPKNLCHLEPYQMKELGDWLMLKLQIRGPRTYVFGVMNAILLTINVRKGICTRL